MPALVFDWAAPRQPRQDGSDRLASTAKHAGGAPDYGIPAVNRNVMCLVVAPQSLNQPCFHPPPGRKKNAGAVFWRGRATTGCSARTSRQRPLVVSAHGCGHAPVEIRPEVVLGVVAAALADERLVLVCHRGIGDIAQGGFGRGRGGTDADQPVCLPGHGGDQGQLRGPAVTTATVGRATFRRN